MFLFYVDWLAVVRRIGNCLNAHTPPFLVPAWEMFYHDSDVDVGGMLIKSMSDMYKYS